MLNKTHTGRTVQVTRTTSLGDQPAEAGLLLTVGRKLGRTGTFAWASLHAADGRVYTVGLDESAIALV